MTGTAILAIVVATGELHDPATAIMLAAAGESLGPDVAIRLLGANQPEVADPVRIERELGAGAVVSLVWRDASRLRANIRLHVASTGHTTTRELVFAEGDTRVERGRTLGLAAASMWPEGRAPPVKTEAPRAPPDASPPPATPPAREPKDEVAAPKSPAEHPPAAARPTAPEPAKPAPTGGAIRNAHAASLEIPRFALGLAASGATGATDQARSIGARIESTFSVSNSWAFRATLSARTGPVAALTDGNDLTLALAAGMEWWPTALRAGTLARFGVRADAMLLRHQVSGSAIPGEAENRGRFLPGFDLLAQMALHTSDRIDLIVAAGGEQALGNTDIRRGSPPVTVATIPAFQLVAEVGIRVGF